MTNLIKKYEGCRLQAYKCQSSVVSIGYGTTKYPDGTPVKMIDIITKEYAEVLLNDYLIKNVYPVFGKIPYQLTEKQRDSIASLIYNIGTPAFLNSKLFKAICKKDWEKIFKNWDWIKADGVVSKGLCKRRAEELALFLEDLK